MNLARILVLVVALAAGGAAAYLALNLIQEQPAPAPAPSQTAVVQQAPAMQTQEILVASQDITLGETINEGTVAWRTWPATSVSSNYIRRSRTPDAIETLDGTIARSSFLAGEPITEAKLARTDGGLLSAMLPAGMRAIAISINASTSAGGFILPNDRVDVIMATRDPADPNRYLTETILRNLRVLAIDQAIEDRGDQQVVVGQTATLELTPEQAEILTVAQQIGDRLALSLRSLADADVDLGDPGAIHLISGQGTGVTIVRNGVSRQLSTGP